MRGKDGKYIWRQNSPSNQMIVLYQRMWGDFDNFVSGILDKSNFILRNKASLEEMEALLKCINLSHGGTEWYPDDRSEESF